MRRKRIFIVLAVCVLVGIGVVAFWPGEREPEYNGKKLSEWLVLAHTLPDSVTAQIDATKEAKEAVRHIGTNALPCVLRWMSYKRPHWKTIVFDGVSKMPSSLAGLTDWVLDKTLISDDKQFSRLDLGLSCLKILGPEAEPAIPNLVRAANASNYYVSKAATVGLAQIGERGINALITIIEDPKHPYRVIAAEALASVDRAKSDSATTVLIRLVCDRDTKLAIAAAYTLGDLNSEPQIVVPALSRGVADPRPIVRMNAVKALGMFEERARPAVPVILNACNDTDPFVRYEATNALRAVAPEVLTNGVRGL